MRGKVHHHSGFRPSFSLALSLSPGSLTALSVAWQSEKQPWHEARTWRPWLLTGLILGHLLYDAWCLLASQDWEPAPHAVYMIP